MGSVAAAPAAKPASRLISLDVFRGLTMAGMVIVNNPGDWATVYPPLLHAEWHGWTPTDLIFPYFLFIVGVSMTLSRGSLGPWGRILRRAAVIAGLGLFLAGFPYFPLATWRIPGVLQRIAVCYLAGVMIFRATAPAQPERLLRHALRLSAWTAGLLLVYWAALMWIRVPGGGAGDLSPDGNVGAFIDRTLMGNHLYRRRPWDPEGILSTVPAIGTTLLGVIGGLLLRSKESQGRKVLWLVSGGAVLIIVGFAWGAVFPINKNLWTSSYVLFTGGAATVTFALCYWAIDIGGWKAWSKPFEILGLNAITLYVLSGLFTKTLLTIPMTGADGDPTTLYRYLYVTLFAPLAAPKNASLLFAASHLVVLFLVLYGLYRKRIFLKA